MNRAQLIEKFNIIYHTLNPEQQDAVSTIYGPVLVIAGPGTGKTQILSARIGKILLETDYLPDNILCLTYTDAGRVAMRKRLQEMIGADAYSVNIHTFHSFCNQIIQENVALFNKNTLDPISDLERIDFLKNIIDNFKKDNPLKRYRNDVYYEIGRLANLFSTMKKEGWTSAYIKDCIKEYLAMLPEKEGFFYKKKYKEFKAGDPKPAAIEQETNKMRILEAAANTFDTYQNMMHQHNRYDFDDMINWVIDALNKHEYLLQDLQEKYQFILVDEFQDTSGTQNVLIQLLCKEVEQPNIFVVGDDDQSIYRFQGANVENIEAYKNKYIQDLKRVVLKSNYRSTQAILDVSKSVIENNEERLSKKDSGIVKDLLAARAERQVAQHKPILKIYENTFQEMVGTTEEIVALINSGVQPQEIAVLYKENKLGKEMIKFFKQKNIPYYSKLKEDLFQIPLSKKIITILRYLSAEINMPYSGDEILFEILHFDLYHIPPFEIAKASVRVNDMRYQNKTSLRQYFQEWIATKNRTLFEDKPHEGLVKITSNLEKWITDSFNTTIIQLFENIMIEGGFLQEALKKEEDKRWHLEVLRALMDFVKEEMQRNPQFSLADLIAVIDLMESEDISIPLYRIYGNEMGVNLLTIHGSKGLEFRHVFIINATANTWEAKGAMNTNYALPDNVFQTLQTADKSAKLEEQRRLFFVGVTRAEEYLTISWSKQDEKQKPLEPTKFIAEITDKIALERHVVQVSEMDMLDYMTIYLLKDKRPTIENGEQDFIAPLLERFEMNATALNNYLNCPLRFYYQSLIKVPSGRNENAEFGSAVHHALEMLFVKMRELDDTFPSLEVFIQDFEWYMHKHRESFTEEAYNRRKEYGHTILTALYQNYIHKWHKVVAVERIFKNVVVEGVPIKGMIDKIEFEGNQVTIVDYKTGNPEKSKDKLKPPTAKEPNGGDYWRQSIFYKLLVDNYRIKDYQVVKTTFQFVEPNDKKEYIVHDIFATEDDLATVRKQIKDTWLEIQNHNFYTGCGKDTCQWCNFVKDNNQYVSLQEALHQDDEDNELEVA